VAAVAIETLSRALAPGCSSEMRDWKPAQTPALTALGRPRCLAGPARAEPSAAAQGPAAAGVHGAWGGHHHQLSRVSCLPPGPAFCTLCH